MNLLSSNYQGRLTLTCIKMKTNLLGDHFIVDSNHVERSSKNIIEAYYNYAAKKIQSPPKSIGVKP